jgi:hypothetical protein
MSPVALGDYLESVRYHLRLGYSAEKEIILELRTHIEDKLNELRERGLSEEEAAKTCIKVMGSAKKVARQLYEAHSQGTWKQTLLAASPHLLFALMFALSWWQGVGYVLIVLTVIFGVAIYAWWPEKPNWSFSWLGYSLLPVVIAGSLIFYLPRGWSWIAIIVYVPLTATLIYHITVQTIRRDWLYSSLMLLPVPIVVAWVITVGSAGEPSNIKLEYIKDFGTEIGLSFLVLALSVAAFIRLRQRWLKIALLLVSGIFTLSLVFHYAEGRLSLPAFLVQIFVVLGLFVTPAVLEHKVRRHETQDTFKEAEWGNR